jgi:hypothetical protein
LSPVADEAQGADVFQIAFASTLYHRNNVIRVPKRSSANPLQTPPRQQLLPMNPARPLQVEIGGPAIDPADRANALIAGKYLIT